MNLSFQTLNWDRKTFHIFQFVFNFFIKVVKKVGRQFLSMLTTVCCPNLQLNQGSIEIKDKRSPTLIHYAAKNGMKKVAETLLAQPGGLQMASISNSDGLNARELAVQASHLELAKIFKDPERVLHDYEYPVLRPLPHERRRHCSLNGGQKTAASNVKSTQSEPPISNAAAKNSDYFYDVPRKSEAFYVIPPPPRPVMEAVTASKSVVVVIEAEQPKRSETPYVPMLPRTTTNRSLEDKPTIFANIEAARPRSASLDKEQLTMR